MSFGDFLTNEIPESGILLFADTSSADMQFGLLNRGGLIANSSFSGSAVENMFDCISDILTANGESIDNVTGICLSIGPGSTIGIRAACALATTLEVIKCKNNFCTFAFNSMHLAQIYIQYALGVKTPITVLAKANTTQAYQLQSNDTTTLAQITKCALQHSPEGAFWLKSNLLYDSPYNLFTYDLGTLFNNSKSAPNIFFQAHEHLDAFKL